MSEDEERAVARLLRALDLANLGAGRFRGEVLQEEGRLFGGHVLAQSVVAAGLTVDEVSIHSLHAYFLRAGKPVSDIIYEVAYLRDGRNFKTRRVTALQEGEIIYEAMISFARPEDGFDHQLPMPEAPDPEGQPTWWETLAMFRNAPPGMRMRRFPNPVDIRSAEIRPRPKPPEELPHRAVWTRIPGTLPESPLIHAALMAYMSDSGMVGTVGTAYGMWGPGGASASLDHTMWWHHPPRFDDWLLYVTDSPAAHAARALTHGHVYNRDGVLVASVSQEALFRRAEPKPAP